MRSNSATVITILVAIALSLGSNSAWAQYVARPKRPVPPPPATSPQRPATNTNTRTAPRLVNGERCGAEGAGKAVLVENIARERVRVTVRDTWLSERGEQRKRDSVADLAGGEKQRIGCTIGDILIEHHSFRIVS
jgi:hypothetical protein